jgi:hypothetical protein
MTNGRPRTSNPGQHSTARPVRLARPRDPGLFTWRPYGKWLLVVTGASCTVVGLSTVWTGLPWLLVPTICGVVVAGTAWFLHRDLRLDRAGRQNDGPA